MPPFESPSPPFHYWKRFNTIQIPILGESDYFNTAIKIAKTAKGRKVDFERIFEERNKKQQEKLLSFITKATNQTIYNEKIFPCKDAQDIVSQVCLTGCLLDFLLLLKGNAFGWEADVAEDLQLDSATSNLSEETNSPINQAIQDPYSKEMPGPLDPYYHDEPGSETQCPDDDYNYKTPIERQIREGQSANATYYISTFTHTRCTTPISNSITYSPNVPASNISIIEKEKEKKASTRNGKRVEEHNA
ncbi:hypothetical protein V8C37DRAFT_413633 [Trichoderma ceciliae]